MSYITVLLSRASCFEALAAVNGSVAGRLECELSLAAALATSSDKVLALASFSILLLIAASLAALGLVHKALLLIEGLFAGSEGEFVATLFADKCFVFEYFAVHRFVLVHWMLPRFVKMVKIFFRPKPEFHRHL